jgi:integrase
MAYKQGLVDCYDRYVRVHGLSWAKPYFRREDPVIQLPTEERINKIISSCQHKNALQFSIIKETGIRPIELHQLTLRYIDLEQGILHVRTAKHGKSRSLKLSQNTLAMLMTYVSKMGCGLNDALFSTPRTMSKTFQRARDRTARKLQDPEIFKVRLYDLRHFFGSMLYHKTKDLLYVKEKMGHRSISNTMKYMHLVDFVNDECIVKIASTLQEFTSLALAQRH